MSERSELQNIDVIYSSHYVRAMSTAKYIAEKNEIKLNVDERLGERKFGVNDISELPTTFFKDQFRDWNYKISNGESTNEVSKRTKEPYMGMYNLVGGKIEKENDGLNEAYRELEEETNIKKKDIDLIHFMNLTYTKWNKELEVYYGILKNEVELIEEVNKLEWVSVNDNFFDMNRYAGEGNIGHIIEEIKIDLRSN